MPGASWTNPLIAAASPDPFIWSAAGRWWLIATGRAPDGRWLPLWSSPDLEHWEFVRGAVAQGRPGSWNRRNFWAPEMLVQDGRYWLYYTASLDGTPENTGNRLGLAVADRPEGPYLDAGVLVDHASLDGSPYRAADGALWLLYVVEHGSSRGLRPGTIRIDRLTAPDRVADDSVELISSHPWQEGPVLLPRPGGGIILTFSVGSWQGGSYRVLQAGGAAPDGPFSERPGCLLASTAEVQGPGHHNFFTGPDRRPWLVYHGWDAAMQQRTARIDRLEFTADGFLQAPGAPSVGPQRWAW